MTEPNILKQILINQATLLEIAYDKEYTGRNIYHFNKRAHVLKARLRETKKALQF